MTTQPRRVPESVTGVVGRTSDYHKGMDLQSLRLSVANHLRYTLAKDESTATKHDRYLSIALAIRDRLIERWIKTQQTYYARDVKRVYYLSMEYLVGRTLGNAIVNLRLEEEFARTLDLMGWKLEELRDIEPDAGLGNGGLGRLAACFIDSMATLQLPGVGYGLRYDFGIFRQEIRDGWQNEEPDPWLRLGHPWEIERPENAYPVRFYGRVENHPDAQGRVRPDWIDTQEVLAVPFDTPIPGYGNNTVNNLRLWSAKATSDFDLDYFNRGDYARAVEQQAMSEYVTKVLYPPDNLAAGRELRLKQQYFLVSASLQDIFRRFWQNHDTIDALPDKVAIQLNDTHPSLAIPEFMRLMVDVLEVEWDPAWEMAQAIFGYTNHTLLPEALETWRVGLLGFLLPRHLQIIYEINHRFLRQVANQFLGDVDRLRRMSLIDEHEDKSVRMAHLAMVGSHSINGVSKLHTRLLKETLARDFAEFFPERFNNKTNGVTPRRWLRKCNPELSELVTRSIGDGWVTDLGQLARLRPLAEDAAFRSEWRDVKRRNKVRLADVIRRSVGVRVEIDSIYDVLVKRIHEYKRQHLDALHVLDLYLRLKDKPDAALPARTVIIGGKAAPGYAFAKLMIKFVTSIAGVVNHDPQIGRRLKVVFLPDYRVSLAERIFPAADLSQQISTAGREASGTGNMKFALNGAVTIGTLDGANIEIREEVGAGNMFIFGLTADQVAAEKSAGYDPRKGVAETPRLRRVIDLIERGFLSPENPELFKPLLENLLDRDPFLVLRDFASYVEAQERVEKAYADAEAWTRMSILNVAGAGRFSSDRAVLEYAREIWRLEPCPIDLE